MNWLEIAKREGELISLPVEEQKALENVCDYIGTYDMLDYVNKIFSNGLLSPLTLKDEEFSKEKNEFGDYPNLRYPDVVKTTNAYMLNLNAHHILIRAKYNHETKTQEEYNPKVIKNKPKLYISKGGVITGEYIDNFVIKQEYIENHKFEINKIPIIPVAIILRKGETYYVVDHREPLLKVMEKYYVIATLVDEKVQSMHMNLRQYKKLGK